MAENLPTPQGTPTILTVAMPKDTNPSGDIFGGWLLSQMDIAGGVAAGRRARGRTATIAVQEMVFHQPVQVGDLVSCHANVVKVGRTSLTVEIEAWATRHDTAGKMVRVTEGAVSIKGWDRDEVRITGLGINRDAVDVQSGHNHTVIRLQPDRDHIDDLQLTITVPQGSSIDVEKVRERLIKVVPLKERRLPNLKPKAGLAPLPKGQPVGRPGFAFCEAAPKGKPSNAISFLVRNEGVAAA